MSKFYALISGLHLDNYVGEDIGSATVHLLSGKIVVHSGLTKINLTKKGQHIEVGAIY